MSDSYESEDLKPITDLQQVRARPQIYFGDLSLPTVPNCLAKEAYCLAIDNIVAKTCTHICSEFTGDGFASVSHNGTSLGVEPEERFLGRSEMEAIAELMKFCAEHAASEYVHSSVCKNGMTALNALSERYELHNYHGGQHYLVAYERGVRISPVRSVGHTKLRGVKVLFGPDASMIEHSRFDVEQLKKWFESIPIDTDGVEISWLDSRGERSAHEPT